MKTIGQEAAEILWFKNVCLVERGTFVEFCEVVSPIIDKIVAERGNSKIEIRNNDDGSLDEVCWGQCRFHLEQMDNGHWWIGIDNHEKLYHINLSTARNTKITARIEEA